MNGRFKGKIMYMVMCIDEFAQRKTLSPRDAFLYLQQFGGIKFLDEFYDIEHTLPFDDTMDTLTEICLKDGGTLA